MTDIADEDVESTEEFYVPDKPPQIEAWKVPDAEGLPDEVKSTEVPEEER